MNLTEIKKRQVAVLIPYYIDGENAFVFLQKRSPTAKRLPGFFGFFGGGLGPDENSEQGLKREIREELGIDITTMIFFAHYEFVGTIVDAYTMKVERTFSNQIKIGEGEFGKFFNYSELISSPMIINQDKLILSNFFGHSEYRDPFYYKV